MSEKFTESDLDKLIDEKLVNCVDYPNVCTLLHTGPGKEKVKARIKELIFQEGIEQVDTAIAQIETELSFQS